MILLEYINEVTINEAIIHVLDNSSEGVVFNEVELELNEETYEYILKHIQKCLKDEELKYAVFNVERNLAKELSQEYLDGKSDIVSVSKELASQLFVIMKSNGNIPSCDLLTAAITTEYGRMLVVLKMDYVKNYTHNIDVVDDKVEINIIPQFIGLPSSGQKIQKCAFIKPIREENNFDLMVIDKNSGKKDEDEYGSNYFINNYLGCKIINNERDLTKTFVKSAEKWTQKNLKDNADAAELVRTSIKKRLKEDDSININEVSDEIFGENKEAKDNFVEFIKKQGIEEKIELDKQWVENKMKRTRLKIDKDIDLYINEETYNDSSRFEIKRNGDGTINMIIKQVRNYVEK
ncbi:37-kD nucleoid-associated bacterial protein [Clostridium acetobutylicum]|nr:37-kD nucleoid-associated bacterial protein [Clostridium acetobutylicum]OOM06294.1 37-kD nucleoid-associated bacterial protein [Clostridium acetobutylicum]